MKTCKANDAPVGAFVEFNGRQMLIVDDSTIHRGIKQWLAGDIDGVCTSYVTDMRKLFCDEHGFNETIGDWDVSNVTNMSGMFSNAKSFNQPLNDWDVSNVIDMQYMFHFANAMQEHNKPKGL